MRDDGRLRDFHRGWMGFPGNKFRSLGRDEEQAWFRLCGVVRIYEERRRVVDG